MVMVAVVGLGLGGRRALEMLASRWGVCDTSFVVLTVGLQDLGGCPLGLLAGHVLWLRGGRGSVHICVLFKLTII